MRARKVIPPIIALGLLLLAAYLLGVPLRDQTQQMHNAVLSLNRKFPGQSFVAERNDLYRLDVLTATREPLRRGQVIFLLSENPRFSPLIRKTSVPASRIENNRYLSFEFEPIRKAKGKQFYFRLIPWKLDPKDVYVWFYSSEEAYPQGHGFARGRQIGGDLQFSSFSRTPLLEAGTIIFSAIADGKPFPLNLAVVYAILLGIYFLLIVLLLARFLSLPD